MSNDFTKLARDSGESFSEVGKFFGMLTYGFLAFLCIFFIGLFINFVINNNKYIKTTGYIVQSFPCTETPIYDKNGKQNGTTKTCPTIIKFKTTITPTPSSDENSFTLPPFITNSPQLPLGFNRNDGCYYQRFDLTTQYSIGDTINIFYLENDPMGTVSVMLFPNMFLYFIIIFFIISLIYCSIMIYALNKFKAYSTVTGIRYAVGAFK